MLTTGYLGLEMLLLFLGEKALVVVFQDVRLVILGNHSTKLFGNHDWFGTNAKRGEKR